MQDATAIWIIIAIWVAAVIAAFFLLRRGRSEKKQYRGTRDGENRRKE